MYNVPKDFPEIPKSRAAKRMEVLSERHRKLEEKLAAARIELELEDAAERDRLGAAAFVDCVRRLDLRHLDTLKVAILDGCEADEVQLDLVKDWFDRLVDASSTGSAADSKEAEAAATPTLSDNTLATSTQQPPVSGIVALREIAPSESPLLLAKEEPKEANGKNDQANRAQSSQPPPEPVLGLQSHETSAVVTAEPTSTAVRAAKPGEQTQSADVAAGGGALSQAPLDALDLEQPATPHAEPQANTSSATDLPTNPQEIKDRQWHGDCIIEVWQKGGCQVIGMETFSTSEDAMEHLAWLVAGARNGDEGAVRSLAKASKAAAEYEPKPPRITGA